MATVSPLLKTNAITGDVNPFPRSSSYINNYVVAASGNVSATVPSGANYCCISCNAAGTWLKMNGTITAAPTANITDGTAPISIGVYYRTFFDLAGITTIGIFCPSAGTVSIEYFS